MTSETETLSTLQTLIDRQGLEGLAAGSQWTYVSLDDLPRVSEIVWDKYLNAVTGDPVRSKEYANGRIEFDGFAMRYHVDAIGTKPEAGYPVFICLHGGGDAASTENDQLYEEMQTYYKASISVGLCVTPRGVADTWNLHFLDQSYAMYDRLIENLIAFAGADPDRIYLLGFSAGGDGVYQVATRMPDRLAGANMSSGHPNGVPADNLYNLPFTIQVGEYDFSYDRNVEGARYGVRMAALAAAAEGGYIHDVLVHRGGNHNRPWQDNNTDTNPKYEIYNDLETWIETWMKASGNNFATTPADPACVKPADPYDPPAESCIKGLATTVVDSNAVRRTSIHERDPLPRRVIWDLSTRAASRSGIARDGSRLFATERRSQLCYWLDISDTYDTDPNSRVDIEIERATNTIIIRRFVQGIRILLNDDLVDLSRDVTVRWGDRSPATTPANRRLDCLARTLLDRGDKRYIFPASVRVQYLEHDGNHFWSFSL